MKRILSLVLAVLMLMSIMTVNAEGSGEELEHVTLEVIMIGNGTKKDAADEVFKAISDYVADRLNAEIILTCYPSGDLTQKLLMRLVAGESWDINFDSDWTGFYKVNAQEGYMDVSELLPVYAPNLYASYQKAGTLDAIRDSEGRITALPWTMVSNNRFFFRWRGDLADAAGLTYDTSKMGTIEDVYQICSDLHKAYPDRYIVDFIPIDMFLTKYNLYPIGHGYCVDLTDAGCKLVRIEDTNAIRECAEWSKKFLDEGLIWADAFTDGHDMNGFWMQGKAIGYATNTTHEFCNYYLPMEEENARTDYFMYYPESYYPNRSPMANALCISAISKNPERALMFLDMLETDQKLFDLILYGIEGKTYVIDENGCARYPEGMNSTNSNYMDYSGRWAFWKPQFMRPDDRYPEGFWQNEADFATNYEYNIVCPIISFAPNLEDINVEISERDAIYGDCIAIAQSGRVEDVDAFVAEYTKKLADADAGVVLAELQDQVDAYLGK